MLNERQEKVKETQSLGKYILLSIIVICSLAWDVFIWGGVVYLVGWQHWSAFTFFFPIILTVNFSKVKIDEGIAGIERSQWGVNFILGGDGKN
jgi:hypothetical protein